MNDAQKAVVKKKIDALRASVTPANFADFFFKAEDGIRDHCVTGVQTCALPISGGPSDSGAANGQSLGESVEALIRSNCTRGAHTTRCSRSRQSPAYPPDTGGSFAALRIVLSGPDRKSVV